MSNSPSFSSSFGAGNSGNHLSTGMVNKIKKPLERLSGVEWASLRAVNERSTQRVFRDENLETHSMGESAGVMAEVLVRGQIGYAATTDLSEAGLENLLKLAKARAEEVASRGVFRFDSQVRPKSVGKYSSSVEKSFSDISTSELSDLMIKITREIRQVSPKIIRAMSIAVTTDTDHTYVSTNGSQTEQSVRLVASDFSAIAQEGSVIQKRTSSGMMANSFQGGYERFVTADFWDRVRLVGENAVELLSAEDCPTGVMDLVLSPDQMMLQIHESIGHPLELDRILGDERNYAGSSFVKLHDFGTLQYGSEVMNVSFDPTVAGELASYAFDDCGNPAKKEMLIEKGKLLRGLGGLESQLRSKVAGVANQRACLWNRPPIDRMANLNLEPGTSSYSDIISSVENGVMMSSNRSWSIDDYRNKFQFGCEYAKKIENGKITKTLRNPNYRGITVPFWTGLKKVGDRSTFKVYGTPFCGKGEPNQMIAVGHASPLCLFSNIEVFGGVS